MSIPITVQTIILREGGQWVAQVLEYDLAAQAATLDDLHYQMTLMMATHIVASEKEGLKPWDLPRAPQEYWDLWHAAKTKVYFEHASKFTAEPPLKYPVPNLDARIAAHV